MATAPMYKTPSGGLSSTPPPSQVNGAKRQAADALAKKQEAARKATVNANLNKGLNPNGTPNAAAPVKQTAAPAPVQAAPATVSAQMDPTLANQLAEYKKRLGSDPSKRAMQDSTLGIQDAAALSAADAKGMMSRRGTLGTQAGDTFLNKNVFAPAQRQAAGAAAQIAQNEEARKDALVLGGTALASAPGNQMLQEKNLALNTQGQNWNQQFQNQQAQWNQQFQTQQAQQQADQAAQQQLLQLLGPAMQNGTLPANLPIPGLTQPQNSILPHALVGGAR